MKDFIILLVTIGLIIFFLFTSGFFEQTPETRTLGYMFDNYEDFSFPNGEDGDEIKRIDEVSTRKYPEYDEDEDITRVWVSSYEKRPLLFEGDLTQNYYIMPGGTIEYNVTIVERNNIEYIKEFWEASEI